MIIKFKRSLGFFRHNDFQEFSSFSPGLFIINGISFVYSRNIDAFITDRRKMDVFLLLTLVKCWRNDPIFLINFPDKTAQWSN